MTVLTPTAAMALALQCVPPSVAAIMVGIAQHESGLDSVAIHRNANGTVDVGLAQVNSANFAWLGLTLETALDPCRNLAAGARVLLAKYNGNPSDTAKAAYATAVTARIRDLGDAPSTPPSLPPDPPVIYAKPAKHAGRDLVYTN
jgi:hypothetical protein